MYVCGCVSIHACVHLACGGQQKLLGVFYYSLLYSFKEGTLPESGLVPSPTPLLWSVRDMQVHDPTSYMGAGIQTLVSRHSLY